IDYGTQLHIVKFPAIINHMYPRKVDWDTESTDGIPDADEFNTHFAREALAKEFCLDGARVRRVSAVAIELVSRIKLASVLPLQEASVAEQASDAARRVRSTAEAEKENLVAGIVVVLDDEHIGVLHIVRQPPPESTASEVVEPAGPNTLAVVDALLDALAVLRRHHCTRDLGDIRLVGSAVPDLIRRVPGPVAADDQPLFWHEVSPRCGSGAARSTMPRRH